MLKLINAKIVFFLLLFFILDTCVLPNLRFQGAQPYLLYILVVYSAFKWPWQRTLAVAFLVGFVRDVSGIHPLGVETSVVMMNALGLIFLAQKMVRDNLVNRLLATFLFVFSTGFVSLIFSALLQNPHWITWHAIGMIFFISMMSAAVTPAVFFINARIFHDQPVIKQMGLFT